MDTIPLDVLLLLAHEFLPRRDLASLSATCTQMTPLRAALFKKLRITKAHYFDPTTPGPHLLDFLRQENSICTNVRDLEVLVPVPCPLPFIEIMSSMMFLRKLYLQFWGPFSYPDSASLENIIVQLVTLPTLQSLTLQNYVHMPIKKITNAFASDARPIDDLCFNNCRFAIQETVHEGGRWLPTNLDMPNILEPMPPIETFIDASKLRSLTLYWPPRRHFYLHQWAMVSLDQLRLRVIGRLDGLHYHSAPSCTRLFIRITYAHFRHVFNDIPAFLLAAEGIQEICIKLIADKRAITNLVVNSGALIHQVLCRTHPATTFLMFALSITRQRRVLSEHHCPWTDAEDYSDWCHAIQARMQRFLPTQLERPGIRFKAELFLEMWGASEWDLTPCLDADNQIRLPDWFLPEV